MADVDPEVGVPKAEAPAAGGFRERRRPGRPAQVSPELVRLLREDSSPTACLTADELAAGLGQPRSAMVGVAMAVVLSVPLWLGVWWIGRSVVALLD